MRMTNRSRLARQSGQTMTEYAVTLAVITVATVGVFTALSGSIAGVLDDVVSLF
jgi:Flp pilus assembly pilin Flp